MQMNLCCLFYGIDGAVCLASWSDTTAFISIRALHVLSTSARKAICFRLFQMRRGWTYDVLREVIEPVVWILEIFTNVVTNPRNRLSWALAGL